MITVLLFRCQRLCANCSCRRGCRLRERWTLRLVQGERGSQSLLVPALRPHAAHSVPRGWAGLAGARRRCPPRMQDLATRSAETRCPVVTRAAFTHTEPQCAGAGSTTGLQCGVGPPAFVTSRSKLVPCSIPSSPLQPLQTVTGGARLKQPFPGHPPRATHVCLDGMSWFYREIKMGREGQRGLQLPASCLGAARLSASPLSFFLSHGPCCPCAWWAGAAALQTGVGWQLKQPPPLSPRVELESQIQGRAGWFP